MEAYRQRIGDSQPAGQYAKGGYPEIGLLDYQSANRNQTLAAAHNGCRDSVLMISIMETDAYDYFGPRTRTSHGNRAQRQGPVRLGIKLAWAKHVLACPGTYARAERLMKWGRGVAAFGGLINLKALQGNTQIKAAVN